MVSQEYHPQFPQIVRVSMLSGERSIWVSSEFSEAHGRIHSACKALIRFSRSLHDTA